MDRNYQYSLLIITRIWFKDGKEMVSAPKSALLCGENKESMSFPKYRIDKTPVTNSDFARFVKATGYKTIAKKTRICIA
jgi:formylglycine-generating enzyme required for sulfatase activity